MCEGTTQPAPERRATIRKHRGYMAPWRVTCRHGVFWARLTWADALMTLQKCATDDDIGWLMERARGGAVS